MQALYRLSDWLRDTARRRTWSPSQALGRRGEDLAHRYLQQCGYRVVGRNYRNSPGGCEIDLIARDGESIVFVEVKSRASDEFGSPDRAVGEEKLGNMENAAREYCRRAEIPWDRARFDIVNVLFTRPPAITHLRDAVGTRLM